MASPSEAIADLIDGTVGRRSCHPYYLSKVSPEWKQQVGEGTSIEWPIGAGGKGNEGVAAFVALAKNSIGYVEYGGAGDFRRLHRPSPGNHG